jgi:small-conductance mechanosensitive channel
MSKPIYEISYAVIAISSGLILYQILFFLLKRWSKKKKWYVADLLHEYMYYPGLILMCNLTLWIAWLFLDEQLSAKANQWIRHLLQILNIGFGGFFVMRAISMVRELALHHYSHQDPLNFSYRKAKTKFRLIERVFHILITFAIIALILTTFEPIRRIGGALLASAGVVGIIVGFAAQKSLSTLFGGIQIAISQPIRIDDTVIVEKEFGTVAEINLTYVVINTWDGRRVVVPVNFFLENKFENWTRVSPEIIGKVYLYTDYNLPVEEVRKEFIRLVESSPLWDRRSRQLIVTDSTGNTMQIRASMSAKNSGDAYDFECFIRENLIRFIQQNYPDSLPKYRLKMI